MKLFLCIVVVFSLLSLPRPSVGQPKLPDEAKVTEERDKLLGTWAVIGYEEDGKTHMYPSTAGYWKFSELEVREWDVNAPMSQAYPLWRSDPTSKPRKLDYATVNLFDHHIMVFQGAYEIDGDKLSWTLPQGFGGNPKKANIDAASKIRLTARPTQMGTVKGDGFTRHIMTRVKDATEAMSPEERKANGKDKK